jgi:YggT family protein
MNAVVGLVQLIFGVFQLLIFARVIMSWLNPDPYHPIAQFIFRTTEPILEPLRRVLPPVGMMDLSPLVALIGLSVIETIILSVI